MHKYTMGTILLIIAISIATSSYLSTGCFIYHYKPKFSY